MCHPAVVMLLTVAMSAYQTSEQNKAADEQADAIKAQAATSIDALSDKSEEISTKADAAEFERKKQLQREVAMTRAAQSEGGVLIGASSLRTISTQLIGAGQDIGTIRGQKATLQKQVGREMEAVGAGKALQLSGLTWTSPLMAGAKAVTSGLSAYTGAGGKLFGT